MDGNQYVTVCTGSVARLYSLTRRGREIADENGSMLKILLFVRLARRMHERAELMEAAFQCARQMDAEMNVYFTDRPMERLMADTSAWLVMREGSGMAELVRRHMPDKRLVVME